MKRVLAAVATASLFFPAISVMADETALDGLLWHYDVTEGGAVVRAVEALPAADSGAPDGETPSPLLETLKIPEELGGTEVVAIGESAFAGQDELREVKVPEGVTDIGPGAFKDCRGLRSVKLPPATIGIHDRAFSGCRSLKYINLGDNLTNIESRAFRDCRALASIDLPKNLASIGEKAFADCSSLHTVTIPPGVTNIASWAFADCTSLSMVIFLGAEPVVGDDTFARVDAKCLFRASSSEGWGVAIPGTWQGRKIVDLAIETYRRRILIFLPSIVGAIGTIAILVLAIVLRERREPEMESDGSL